MRFDVAAFAVRNWQFTLVAFALLAMLGLNALMTTPRSEDPHFPIPVVIVRAVLPGAEPAEMEQLVADPIEDALDGLDDVSKISSTSLDGAAVVGVEFDWSVNTERKYDEVVREVNALRPNLPAGLAQLEVRRARTTARPTCASVPARTTFCSWPSASRTPTRCSSTAACPWRATPNWAWW